MWTPSLPRVPVRYSSRQCDRGRGPTEEAGGSETTWIQRRTVEDRRAVLAGGSKRTARDRGYTFLLERRCGILVRKELLACGKGVERTHDDGLVFVISFPIHFFVTSTYQVRSRTILHVYWVLHPGSEFRKRDICG